MLVAKITLASGADGGLLVPAAGNVLPNETLAEAIARVATRDAPQGSTFTIIDTSLAPIVPPLAQLAAQLVSAGKAACDAVTAQILTCETHLAGYTNAAMYVAATGAAPASGPAQAAFAALAAANGMTTSVFATLVAELSASAMNLSGILATLQGAAVKAAAPADLAAALTAFESAIGAEVAGLNGAGLTAAIKAPAAISIAGINA